MAKKKDTFQEVVQKLWPKTKKELRIAMKNAKKMIDKGEKYLKKVSKKSIRDTKKLSLNMKKEKLYYNLGRIVGHLPKSKWGASQKANKIIKEIKAVDKEIKGIK